jgi:hypothetical protein
MEKRFIDSIRENRLILSLGTKGSGKSYLLCNFLKHAFKHKLFQRYVLILPAFSYEQNDSYDFIDTKDKNIHVFEAYDEVIIKHLMKIQSTHKTQLKTFVCIDDASGQDIFYIDGELRQFITVLRHTNCALWCLVHACSGILSPFIRQNCDILILCKMTNRKLITNIYEEYLSMIEEYQNKDGFNKFVQQFRELMTTQKYGSLLLDLRENYLCWEVNKFFSLQPHHS